MECGINERCDVVVVDPRTGKLYLEQSDDLVGTRVYNDRTWGLSHRVEYELQESLVQSVQDFLGSVYFLSVRGTNGAGRLV